VDLRGRGQPITLDLHGACTIGELLNECLYHNIIPVRVWDNFEINEVTRNTTSLPFYLMSALNAVVLSRFRTMGWNENSSERVQNAWRQYVSVLFELEPPRWAATDRHSVWYEYVNEATEFIAGGLRNENPLFVFAFEDMHLAPRAAKDLQQALRQLSHPRLCYVFSRTLDSRVESRNELAPAKPFGPHLSTLGRALLGEDEF